MQHSLEVFIIKNMRAETKVGLLFYAIVSIINLTRNNFAFLPEFISGFLTGLFLSLGIFMFIVGLIPENIYNNLLYRKWIANRKS